MAQYFGDDAGELVPGTSGIDIYCGAGGNDPREGGAGNDTLVGAAGFDRLDGGDALSVGAAAWLFRANDPLYGGLGGDGLNFELGSGSVDLIKGGAFACGGHGRSIILGGTGTDLLYGEDGNHLILANDAAATKLHGGLGESTVVYGGEGDHIIHGQFFLDRTFGRVRNDLMLGYTGGDTLSGDEGHAAMSGEWHDDRLPGGVGYDRIFGGEVFACQTVADRPATAAGRDRITNFQTGLRQDRPDRRHHRPYRLHRGRNLLWHPDRDGLSRRHSGCCSSVLMAKAAPKWRFS